MKLQEPGLNPDDWSIELWAAILWRKLSTKWGYFLPGQLQLNREEKNKSQSGQIIVKGQLGDHFVKKGKKKVGNRVWKIDSK